MTDFVLTYISIDQILKEANQEEEAQWVQSQRQFVQSECVRQEL